MRQVISSSSPIDSLLDGREASATGFPVFVVPLVTVLLRFSSNMNMYGNFGGGIVPSSSSSISCTFCVPTSNTLNF